jgi:signal transduction histidine kinase
LMERRGAFNERAVRSIVAQTGHLERLIGDLLDASRLEAGALELRPEPLDLVEPVRACAEEAQATWERHTIRVEAPDAPLEGTWDRDRVSQVIGNLLGNAVKYSPDGGEILVRVRDRGDEADVSIRDQGVGIDAGALARLFDRFYRAEDVAGSIRGVGLGLYISKELVAAHGGRLWAESAGAGRGSTFHVTLPYRPATPEVAAAASE